MKAKHHFWSSLALGGGLWAASGEPMMLAGAMAGGFLIDADHVVDQLWSLAHGAPHRRKLTPEEEAARGPRGWWNRYVRPRKLVRLPLIFHSIELLVVAVLCSLLWRWPLLIGFTAGYALHIVLDLYRHHHEFRSPFFYSILFRLRRGFRRDELIKAEYL